MNIADIVLIAILVVFIIISSSRGLMLSIFSIGSYFLAIVLAVKFSPAFAKLLSKTSIVITIKSKVSQALDKIITDFVNDSVQTQLDAIVTKFSFSKSMQENIGIDKLQGSSQTTSGMLDTLSTKISDLILLVIAFVIVYIIAKIVLFFISEIIKKTSKLPVIRSFDKLGGAGLGLIEGVLAVWVLFMFMFMFRASNFLRPVFDVINESKLALFLYKNNLVLNFISNYLEKIRI